MAATMLAADIERRLRAVANPARAEYERRYLRSELEHVGASLPQIRSIARAGLAAQPGLGHDELVRLVGGLWSRPVHECRIAAVELLVAAADELVRADLRLVEQMIRESGTWALVDGLASIVAGGLIERWPELGAELDRWSTDASFWVRRAAMLALLVPLRRGEGDFARFAGYADAMLDEREFFIRKAIGWVLRETGKKRPDLVYEWLAPRAARASGVTVREAAKYLSDQQRQVIASARTG